MAPAPIVTHALGYPRMGETRELKFALEKFWRGEIDDQALEDTGKRLRARNWQAQKDAGLDFVTVGDFAYYDHMLNHIQLLGCEPARFGFADEDELTRYFTMARGQAGAHEEGCGCGSHGAFALEMTKWFDTNYHYLVPEFHPDTEFKLNSERLFDEVAEAQALGHRVKAVLVGPLTFLYLGKAKAERLSAHAFPHPTPLPEGEGVKPFNRLDLLERLLPVYGELLARLRQQGVEWVQVDEPILGLDLPEAWRNAFEPAYHRLNAAGVKLLLATYFGPLQENLSLACKLPVAGLHVDAVRAPQELAQVADWLPAHKLLSVGIVDGRNVWRADLDAALAVLKPLAEKRPLALAPSCSLLHVPLDLNLETALDPQLKSWLAFARQKLDEIVLLKTALLAGEAAVAEKLADARRALVARRASPLVHCAPVKQRAASLAPEADRRDSPFPIRQAKQRARFKLPHYPTTTIGSFPQTPEIRAARAAMKRGELSAEAYAAAMKQEIAQAVRIQEELGLDVLVHGEAERNDMVEYFGEQLEGFAFTRNGWVQSYGSRCVKPPIIFGDVSRPRPMSVEWARYAQSLTDRPMKGMLTGPVTILQWSFVRDDQPRELTCLQIALAIRDEVLDLERAGIAIIQIDEPAIREGLPLRRAQWKDYLAWAVRAFRISASGVADETQIHTHMCYSEFNDILPDIAAMDADVITIETSRSDMELLRGFGEFNKARPHPGPLPGEEEGAAASRRCFNEIGPGVWDIHSPRVPAVGEMVRLMQKAAAVIPPENLWVNPDCGLKTRGWPETLASLRNMVEAAKQLRSANASVS